jgi:hypothetical protein
MSQEIRRRIAARRTGHHTAQELAFPHYALGAEQLPEDLPGKLHVGRFSDGHEALPDTGEKEHVGRFSDGVEALPERAHDKAHVGLFADGAA